MSKLSAPDTFPFCQHLDGLIDELRQFAPIALQEFDQKAIHKARVTTRRLKAALELLRSVIDRGRSRPLERLGRKLRRRLGPLRDIDVMIGHLDEIEPTSRIAPARDWFRQRLIEDRNRARLKSAGKAVPAEVLRRLGGWWGLRQDVIEANPAVSSLLGESLHNQLDQFIHHADALSQKEKEPAAKTGAVADHESGALDDPHELRIAGKSLRYTLELAEAEGHSLPKIVMKMFKEMQECLGLWHDHVVLAQCAMGACLEAELPLHDPVTQRLMLLLIDKSMKTAQQQMQSFALLWNEHGEELSHTIRELFPLTQSLTESKTDHDPAGSPTPSVPAAASISPPPAA